jgi:hypothetical protein
VEGSWQGLKDPHSIFLSSSLAKILFGDADPWAEQMRIDNRMDVKVTGVYEDLPHNSNFAGHQVFCSLGSLGVSKPMDVGQGFKNNFVDIYVELAPSVDFETASANIRMLSLIM